MTLHDYYHHRLEAGYRPPVSGSSPTLNGKGKLSHQKSQNMGAAVREVTDDNHRTRQNDRGIGADVAELHVTNGSSKPDHRAADRVDGPIDHPDIEKLPQSFARTHLDRLNDRGIVNLVDVILVLEQSRHDKQRFSLEHEPTDTDARE